MIDQEHTVTCGRADPPDRLDDIRMLLKEVRTIPDRLMVHHPVSQEPGSVITLVNEVPIARSWRKVGEGGLYEPGPARCPQALVIGLAQERRLEPEGKLCDDLASFRGGSSVSFIENHVCVSKRLELTRLEEGTEPHICALRAVSASWMALRSVISSAANPGNNASESSMFQK